MNSKTILGILLTFAGVAGLIYAAVNEIGGYASHNLLFGAIFFGVFAFFLGLVMLRDIIDQKI